MSPLSKINFNAICFALSWRAKREKQQQQRSNNQLLNRWFILPAFRDSAHFVQQLRIDNEIWFWFLLLTVRHTHTHTDKQCETMNVNCFFCLDQFLRIVAYFQSTLQYFNSKRENLFLFLDTNMHHWYGV